MSDLSTIFASLTRHHVVTSGASPLPDIQPGIEWRYAANGLFKRGRSATIELQAQICPIDADVPGMANLMPYVCWPHWHSRLPGQLLAPLLADAQRAGSNTPIARPIEKQYFFVWRDVVRVVAPREQEGSPARVRYTMPQSGPILCDLHSHHAMRAYFSQTDDRDDDGLSVSAVIGNIYARPEIVVRMNIYGHHCPIPALMAFDNLGPFTDRYGGGTADA